MQAIGADAPEPDVRAVFEQLVAGIDVAEPEADPGPVPAETEPTETEAASAKPQPTVAPAEAPPVPRAAPVPVEDRERPADPQLGVDAFAPPKPAELVAPPEPERHESWGVDSWARAFPHLVWLSVVAGLAGQVFGFATAFGMTAIAWIVAGVLGGTFEFMMVSCSSRGLRAIGLGRSWREFVPFLLLGTVANVVAAYMNLSHFEGWLGIAACMVSVLGYLAHVFSHLYDEVENRKQMKAWTEERDRVQAELAARAAAERAAYDVFQQELTVQRREALRKLSEGAKPPTPSAPPTRPEEPPAATSKPALRKSSKKPTGKATKADAVRIGVEKRVYTPAPLRQALTELGYPLPSSETTIENWCKVIKTELGIK
jgi:hypothetical protein